MRSIRRIRSIPKDTPQQGWVLWIVHDMGSNAQMVLLTSRRENGKRVQYPRNIIDSPRPARYANMDFALLSTLLPEILLGIVRILISYDIACQWIKRLQERISQYSISATLDLSSLSYWKVVVPKFHLSGHGPSCQLGYNINYTKGAGRMCGEGIESGWSQSGSMLTWIRENGPYARRAILDGHWGECNWQKLLGLRTCFAKFDSCPLIPFQGVFLLKNLRSSLAWSKSQRAIATSLSQRYPKETISEWIEMRNRFDRDLESPNPYKEPKTRMFLVLFLMFGYPDTNVFGSRCYDEPAQT